MTKQRPQIFTWHIHGSYLYYLSQCDIDLFIPVNADKTEGYYGRGETFPFGPNVHEINADEVKNAAFDVILFQTTNNYLTDQYQILSESQRMLPRIYLEHDPPRQHPTDTTHVMNNKEILLVHVTHFNKLMWNTDGITVKVIEHGVIVPDIPYKGDIPKGIVVINNLPARGRLAGFDIFNEVKKKVPLDLAGMGAEKMGFSEVLHPQLPAYISNYRFFFNPTRYTSLGLAICEAMMLGIPVVGLATTELSTVIQNGVNGFIHTDIGYLIRQMKQLLEDKDLAKELGARGKETALQRFNITRFKKDWENLIDGIINNNKGKILLYDQKNSVYQ